MRNLAIVEITSLRIVQSVKVQSEITKEESQNLAKMRTPLLKVRIEYPREQVNKMSIVSHQKQRGYIRYSMK